MKPQQQQRKAALGAVAYLNMLPFFADDPQVLLCDAPSQLNTLLTSGELMAGCCSVIAGLEAGLEPLIPHMGVAAEASVGSVYLEPLDLGDEPDRLDLWSQWLSANRNGVNKLAGKAPPLFWPPTRGRMRILTCGASAQSLWIVKTLSRLQGLETEILAIPIGWHTWPEEKILLALQGCGQADDPLGSSPTLTALLVIGDPALVRKHTMPEKNRAPGNPNEGPHPWPWRLDVADLWASFSGLPCLFALWFASHQSSESERIAAAKTLESATQKWLQRPSANRAQVACRFLAERGVPSCLWSQGTEELERYLNNLRYDLNLPAYAASLKLMRELVWASGLADIAHLAGHERTRETRSRRMGSAGQDQTTT